MFEKLLSFVDFSNIRTNDAVFKSLARFLTLSQLLKRTNIEQRRVAFVLALSVSAAVSPNASSHALRCARSLQKVRELRILRAERRRFHFLELPCLTSSFIPVPPLCVLEQPREIKFWNRFYQIQLVDYLCKVSSFELCAWPQLGNLDIRAACSKEFNVLLWLRIFKKKYEDNTISLA